MSANDDSAHDRAEALARLGRVHGERGMRAAVLALIVDTNDDHMQSAWCVECADVPTADAIRDDVLQLNERQRLPVLEAFEARVRQSPKPERRALLQALRRLIVARRSHAALDRLHWLQLRRALGERAPIAHAPQPENDMSRLPQSMREKIGSVTAYLARIVPDGGTESGEAWRAGAIQRFMPLDAHADPTPPDADALVAALEEVEALPWMLRPVLMRAWVDTALEVIRGPQLPRTAADALRLVASLLDSPMPPTLAQHFDEIAWAAIT